MTIAETPDHRTLLLKAVFAAVESERKRIAAEIHDDPLQLLGFHLMKVRVIRQQIDRGLTDQAEKELDALGDAIEETIGRLRSIVRDLRPPTLSEPGLLPSLDDLASAYTDQTGVAVTLISRLGRRLSADDETLVYRLAQEGLINIRKHASAGNVRIVLLGDGDWYSVVIEDDGSGFDPEEAQARAVRTGHFGLSIMRERAELIGGTLTIHSTVGEGTRLLFRLPRLQ
ncbi:MAG: sensor histidine kinase [Chloroflexi bacterium]|nr:sensor histidine kinase [Chloroflexota bacterium]